MLPSGVKVFNYVYDNEPHRLKKFLTRCTSQGDPHKVLNVCVCVCVCVCVTPFGLTNAPTEFNLSQGALVVSLCI